MSTIDRSTWNRAKPYTLPRPTYWPAALALGSVLLLWGILTSRILSVIGAVLFTLSMVGWIAELLRAPGEEDEHAQPTKLPGHPQHLPR